MIQEFPTGFSLEGGRVTWRAIVFLDLTQLAAVQFSDAPEALPDIAEVSLSGSGTCFTLRIRVTDREKFMKDWRASRA